MKEAGSYPHPSFASLCHTDDAADQPWASAIGGRGGGLRGESISLPLGVSR